MKGGDDEDEWEERIGLQYFDSECIIPTIYAHSVIIIIIHVIL